MQPAIPSDVKRALQDLEPSPGDAEYTPPTEFLPLFEMSVDEIANANFDQLLGRLHKIMARRATAVKGIIVDAGVLRMYPGLRSRLLNEVNARNFAAMEFVLKWSLAQRNLTRARLAAELKQRNAARLEI